MDHELDATTTRTVTLLLAAHGLLGAALVLLVIS